MRVRRRREKVGGVAIVVESLWVVWTLLLNAFFDSVDRFFFFSTTTLSAVL